MDYNFLGKTGMKVSRLSFGASSLGGVFHPVDESCAIKAVHAALECGINFFDVAPAYAGTVSETVLGKALRAIGIIFLRRSASIRSPALTAKIRSTTPAFGFATRSRKAPGASELTTSI